MLVTNQTAQDYYFGPLHIPGGVGQTLTVDDSSASSLYLNDDSVADAINTLAAAGKITVSAVTTGILFPRPTGTPEVLHGQGSPEGLVYGGQGSIFLRADVADVYKKTTGIHLNTGWVVLAAGSGAPAPATSFPGSPTDGQECVIVDSTASPTYAWHYQYSSAAGKWLFVGGSDKAIQGATLTVASASPTDFVGGSTTVPVAGVYEIDFGAQLTNPGSGAKFLDLSVNGGVVATVSYQAGVGVIVPLVGFAKTVSVPANTVVKLQGRGGDATSTSYSGGYLKIHPVTS